MFIRSLDQKLELIIFSSRSRKIFFYTVSHGLYSMIAGGFEIALILRLTGSFERIVFVNLFMYVLLYLFFVAGTFMLRSGKASRGFRLDLLFQILGCFYMLIFFSYLSNSYILAGFFVFKGISEGLFWSTLHSTFIHSVHDDKRDRYALTAQTITIILGMILPVFAGFVISNFDFSASVFVQSSNVIPSGYFPVYLITGLLSCIALLLSPVLKIPCQIVNIHNIVSIRSVKEKRSWISYLSCGACVSVAIGISVGIMNFRVLKTELNMGFFASWIALASAVFFFAVRRMSRKRSLSRLRMIFLGEAGEVFSRVVYACFFSFPGLIAKSLLDSFIVPFRTMFADNIIKRRIEILAKKQNVSVAEVILFQETIILISRVFICCILILVLNIMSFDPVKVARALLFIFMGYSFIDFVLLKKIDRGSKRL